MLRYIGSAGTCVLGLCLATTMFVPAAQAAGSNFSLLYTFTGGNDGANPDSGLIADKKGNLYGTAASHGAGGAGTVYELAPNGNLTVLLPFDVTDGYSPGYGRLTLDGSGNLYGATVDGGPDELGNVYKLAPDGSLPLDSPFTGGSDGQRPYSDVVIDKKGNVYGTTYEAGANGEGGTVFEVTPDGTQTVLYSFCSQTYCTDGFGPFAQLSIDKKGNLYGTTVEGGAYAGEGADGGGTVFELSPPARGQTTWTHTVLYSFNNTPDPKVPFAGVIADKSGNLYGTTDLGGTGSCDDGCGTVFKLAPDGTETTLYNFLGGSDGQNPWAALVADKNGDFYGTTSAGGTGTCQGGSGCGTVFKLSPDTGQCTSSTGWCETVLYTFTGGNDGAEPLDPLHLKGSWLYGTADTGGADGYGTIFKVKN